MYNNTRDNSLKDKKTKATRFLFEVAINRGEAITILSPTNSITRAFKFVAGV